MHTAAGAHACLCTRTHTLKNFELLEENKIKTFAFLYYEPDLAFQICSIWRDCGVIVHVEVGRTLICVY